MAAQPGLSTVNLANAWLNTLRNTSFVIANLYAQLHTGQPGAAGTSNVSAGSTARPAVSLAAAANGAIALTGTLPAWSNGGASETITHVSLWSSSTPGAGTFYVSGVLGVSKAWVSDEGLTLTVFGITLGPQATSS